jgi:hypothetical protein
LFNFWLLYVGRFFSSKNEHFCEKIEKNWSENFSNFSATAKNTHILYLQETTL